MAIRSTYIQTLDFEALDSHLNSCALEGTAKSFILLIADEPFDVNPLNTVLARCTAPIIGGVCPGLIYGGKTYNRGMLVIDLPFELVLIEGELDDSFTALPAMESTEEGKRTAFLFVDSLTANKGQLIHSLYNEYGTRLRYIGGGAGSISFTSIACILSNKGLRSDAFVMGLTSAPVSLGVAHGWHPISEIMKVTESKGRELISINWEPAFKVYQKVVEKHSGRSFAGSEFFELAKSYPFGKPMVQAEYVVRDPFGTDNASIHLVDAVEPGEFVYIMHGEKESLLEGARQAAYLAHAGAPAEATASFCIDCISRRLFLGEDFSEELLTVSADSSAVGALTIGELANAGDSYLELYNKTICVARL